MTSFFLTTFKIKNSVLWLKWIQVMDINQNQTFLCDKSDTIFFSKIFEDCDAFKNQNFSVLWLKWTQNNRNETKSDIFPWDIFESDIISFFSKKYWSISMPLNIKISRFMTTVNTNYGHHKGFFHGTYFMGHFFILTSFFIGCKILKYFNDFYNWHFSISLQK